LLQYLRKQQGGKDLKLKTAPRAPAKGVKLVPQNVAGDNSNTQFALLALWAARRYDLPLEYTIARVEQRFRSSQHLGGWGYTLTWGRPYGSMTCAGLLGLAVGRAWGAGAQADGVKLDRPKVEDEGIADGLRALGALLDDPSDKGSQWAVISTVKKGAVNL